MGWREVREKCLRIDDVDDDDGDDFDDVDIDDDVG